MAVLASGRGTNLQAILDAIHAGTLPAEVVGVFSDKPEARALRRVPEALRWSGRPSDHDSREAFDTALGDAVAAACPDWIVCAGYMRILGDAFSALTNVGAWKEALRPGRIERARGDTITYDVPEASGGPVPSLRVALYVLITMVPTGIAYILFKDPLEAAFSDPRFASGNTVEIRLRKGELTVNGWPSLAARVAPFRRRAP